MGKIGLMKAGTAIGLTWAAIVGGVTPAFAQNAEAEEDSTGLGEIVVTAQRREENLQKAAVAITAVDSEALTRASVTDVTAITRVAPSLQIGTLGAGQSQFYLRGVGNFTSNSNSESAVTLNIDGVPIVRTSAVQGLFYDLERIEVLKGPQGTLYGRNATGGAVNIITRAPQLGQTEGFITASYGNYDAIKLEGAVNVPLGENGALRVSGNLSKHDGYMSDGTDDEDIVGLRVQLAAQLTDTFKIRVSGDYAHVDGLGAGVTVRGLNRSDRIGSFDPRANPFLTAGFNFPARMNLGTRAGSITPNTDHDFFGFSVQADIETPIGDLTILPGYRRADMDSTACASQCYRITLKDDQYSIETRLASNGDGPLDYLFGFFYLKEIARERPNYNQDVFVTFARFNNDVDSIAGFARFTYNLTDQFRLTAAGRYTSEKKHGDLSAFGGRIICTVASCAGTPVLRPIQLDPYSRLINSTGGVVPVQPYAPGAILVGSFIANNREQTYNKFTYRLAAEYDIGPSSMLYASYETGFKSGGFFNTIDDPFFKPETIRAWTIGSKNRFFDNRLQANLELFWWDYKDQQISRLTTNSIGGIEFQTNNIGATRVRGMELELQAKLGPTTRIYGTVQYLDAKRLDFVYSSPAAVGPPVTGCPFTPAGSTFTVNCTGTRALNAPEWTLNFGLEQTFDLSHNSRLAFNADGRYTSEQFTGVDQLAALVQEGYFTADLQLRLEFEQPKIFIAGFVNNVTNQHVANFSGPSPAAGASVIYDVLRAPRTYGVRVGYRF